MPATIEQKDTDTTNLLGKPYHVILYNDSCHSQDEVAMQIIKATGCRLEEAMEIMLDAHNMGMAIAFKGSQERCEQVSSVLQQIKLKTAVEPG
jgi:ATP-dependent Clp protease adaptor protein ClpS